MAEQVNLTNPYQPDPRATSTFQVSRLDLNWEGAEISIYLIDPVSKIRRAFRYEGQTALNLMIALNKANLSIKSLHRRVIEQLINDGKLEGSVSGSPD